MTPHNFFPASLELARLTNGRTGRCSSWDVAGRNADRWIIPAGKRRVLADIQGPGVLTHLWMTQHNHYRECLLQITWDDAPRPSVLVPLGDFFCLGHGLVNSFQSLLFTASANQNYTFNTGCALNCYAPMPFHKRAKVELINESREDHGQYFYVDYERGPVPAGLGYFHAEFRRANPFGGWGSNIWSNTPPANIVNTRRRAWRNNYVILETKGRGHYIGCNLSVTNFQGTWWGEGDDMIWVDGYKWPPDLHGTGSEDYLNQAWGMQPNAFLRNGSSIHEQTAIRELRAQTTLRYGGYQSSYVFHLENPVRFQKEIKVTIEHGHGNHLANEMSSVAYWYAEKPTAACPVPPVAKRLPVRTDAQGNWIHNKSAQVTPHRIRLEPEMRRSLRQIRGGKWFSPFVGAWKVSRLLPHQGTMARVPCVRLGDDLDWQPITADNRGFIDIHDRFGNQDGIVYLGCQVEVARAGRWIVQLGHDGGATLFVDGQRVLTESRRVNPAMADRSHATVNLSAGTHEIICALNTDAGNGWGIFLRFEVPPKHRRGKPAYPKSKGD